MDLPMMYPIVNNCMFHIIRECASKREKKPPQNHLRRTYLTTYANSFARTTCSSLKDDNEVVITMTHDLEFRIM